MSNRFEDLWRSMETEPTRGRRGMLRRRLTAQRDDGLFLGLELGSGNRLFLVELGKGVQFQARRIPKWKEIGVDRIVEEVDSGKRIVRISLLNTRFSDVFTAFAEDLYKTIAPLRRSPEIPRVLYERLEKWLQFFRSYGPEGLTRQEQLGLFGELWFLRDHVLPRMRGLEAVRRWKGPENAPQDFHFERSSVEVKTSGHREPREIRISSAEQLEDSQAGSLHIFVACIAEGGEGGLTLPGLVTDVRERLKDQKSGQDLFNRKLQDAGYLDVHSREYAEHYEVVEEVLFRVTDGFPRISGVADGISDVHYRLALAFCRPFQVDLHKTLGPIVTGSRSP